MLIYFYESGIGEIGIAEKEGRFTNLYFANDKLPQDMKIYETLILKEAARQLENYLAGNLQRFSLPLEPEGIVSYR